MRLKKTKSCLVDLEMLKQSFLDLRNMVKDLEVRYYKIKEGVVETKAKVEDLDERIESKDSLSKGYMEFVNEKLLSFEKRLEKIEDVLKGEGYSLREFSYNR